MVRSVWGARSAAALLWGVRDTSSPAFHIGDGRHVPEGTYPVHCSTHLNAQLTRAPRGRSSGQFLSKEKRDGANTYSTKSACGRSAHRD